MEYLFMLGRVVLAGYFLLSSYRHFKNLTGYTAYTQSKGVMMPREAVIVTGIMLVLGGLGLLLEVYTVWAISLLIIFLLAAAFFMHRFWKITDPMVRMGERINFEKNLAIAAGLLMVLSIYMAIQ